MTHEGVGAVTEIFHGRIWRKKAKFETFSI